MHRACRIVHKAPALAGRTSVAFIECNQAEVGKVLFVGVVGILLAQVESDCGFQGVNG